MPIYCALITKIDNTVPQVKTLSTYWLQSTIAGIIESKDEDSRKLSGVIYQVILDNIYFCFSDKISANLYSINEYFWKDCNDQVVKSNFANFNHF